MTTLNEMLVEGLLSAIPTPAGAVLNMHDSSGVLAIADTPRFLKLPLAVPFILT